MADFTGIKIQKSLIFLDNFKDKIYEAMLKDESLRSDIPDKFFDNKNHNNNGEKIFSYLFDKIYFLAKYEMYRQMALKLSGDMALYDVKRLIYSLLVVSYNNKFSNNLIQDKALEMIFDTQRTNPNALWPTGQLFPLSIDALMSVSSIECACDLLDSKAIAPKLINWFPEIKTIYDFHARSIQSSDDNVHGLIGWYPPHFRDKTPLSYITAFALSFIKKFCNLITYRLNKLAKETLNIHYRRPSIRWDDIYDSLAVKSKLMHIINSFQDNSNMILEKDICTKQDKKITSAIFFGIPGTGKTSYARALANKMGWEYIELTPGVFFSGGQTSIIKNINNIFESMLHLEKTIVFIDEIDDLIRDRDNNENSTFDPRNMYVNTLLPRFQEIHDNSKIVLILATNHYEMVDKAIARPGRIDLIIPVGPISLHGRVSLFYKNIIQEEDNVKKKRDLLLTFLGQTENMNINELDTTIKELIKIKKDNKIKSQDMINIIKNVKRNDNAFRDFSSRLTPKNGKYLETRPDAKEDSYDSEKLINSMGSSEMLKKFTDFSLLIFGENHTMIKNEVKKINDFVNICIENNYYAIISPFYDNLFELKSSVPEIDHTFSNLKNFIFDRK
jgi:DNA polymerase III delta prime subunit